MKNYVSFPNWNEEVLVEDLDHLYISVAAAAAWQATTMVSIWPLKVGDVQGGTEVHKRSHSLSNAVGTFHCPYIYLKGRDRGWAVNSWRRKVSLGEVATKTRELHLHCRALLALVTLEELETVLHLLHVVVGKNFQQGFVEGFVRVDNDELHVVSVVTCHAYVEQVELPRSRRNLFKEDFMFFVSSLHSVHSSLV